MLGSPASCHVFVDRRALAQMNALPAVKKPCP